VVSVDLPVQAAIVGDQFGSAAAAAAIGCELRRRLWLPIRASDEPKRHEVVLIRV
jgi:hypothetical protein